MVVSPLLFEPGESIDMAMPFLSPHFLTTVVPFDPFILSFHLHSAHSSQEKRRSILILLIGSLYRMGELDLKKS